METLKLVRFEWLSQERYKYILEDIEYPWNEFTGRMYLFEAHRAVVVRYYADALAGFEQALVLLAKEDVRQDYYYNALADKALLLCFLARYEEALSTIDQALAMASDRALSVGDRSDRDMIEDNRAAVLVLNGAYSEALDLLNKRLKQHPQNSSDLRFTLATCLLHLERYDEAVAAYEQVKTEDGYLHEDEGLKAACQRQQPDWDNL